MTSKYDTLLTLYNGGTKIWSGLKIEPEYGADVNIGQLALERLMQNPLVTSEICSTENTIYSNYEMAVLAKRCALHFEELATEQGEVIGICADNTSHLTPLILGAFLKGLTISTLDPCLDVSTIKHIYNITRPILMFCDGNNYSRVKQAFQEINLPSKIYTMIDHKAGVPNIKEFLKYHLGEKTYKGEPLKYGPTQTAAIVCSSGTTGLPKGVCVSYHCLANKVNFRFVPRSVLLCFSKIHWISCLGCIVGNVCSGTTRILTRGSFDAQEFLKIIHNHYISFIIMNPSQLAAVLTIPELKLHKYNLESVQKCVVVSCAVPYELVKQIKPYMPNAVFTTCYAMTEAGIGISGGLLQPDGSCGQLKINTDVKLLNETGDQLEHREVGEICIRTIYKWAGYYGNAEATAAMQDAEGWLHTGDLGYFNENNELFVVDRIKDIFKYNGYQISPSLIESVIHQLNGVMEVSAFGIPNLEAGHLPAAAIIRLPNDEGNKLTVAEVHEHVKSKMSFFDHLRGGVYFLKEFPKTTTGKNKRREIAQICISLHNVDGPSNIEL